jgi:ABC-type polysaccharide/polyol phosphate export permease
MAIELRDGGKTGTAGTPRRSARAARDIIDGLGKSWLWTAMAMQDVRLRYRGSVLGPFWLTLSTAIMIAAMGVIYARLFRTDISDYLPYLAIGLVIWQFLSALITDGCQAFLAAQTVILQTPMPFSVHVFRMVSRNFIILGHNLVIVPIVLIFQGVPIGLGALLIFPAFLLLAIDGTALGLLLGMISARFRDVPPIVANFVQVLFFVTPIFWSPDALGPYKTLAELNPLFAAIDVVRAPLMGSAPAPNSWWILIAATLVGGTISFAMFARFRSRIAYWI